MLEGLKEAMQYLIGVGNEAEKVQVLEICGETYANKRLSVTEHRRERQQLRRHPCQHWSITLNHFRMNSRQVG